MATQRSKFAYDRDYYENLARSSSFDGNAVRKLDIAEPLYDEPLYDEEAIDDPEEFYEEYSEASTEIESRTKAEPVQKVRRSYGMGIVLTVMAATAIGVLMVCMFNFVSLKVEISRAGKQLTKEEALLTSVQTLNEYKAAELDNEPDRNYIYTVAVGRLGMVYPTANSVVYYNPGEDDHVRQYAFVP